MTFFTFNIPDTLLLSQNQRLHHMAKANRTRSLREMARLTAARHSTDVPCALDVTIGWPDRRRRDAINISPTVKALIDGIVDAGVIPDDSSKEIESETYRSRIAGLKGITVIDLTLTPIKEAA